MLNFRRGESPTWKLELFADEAEQLPVDCIGQTLTIVASTMGFTPAIAWDDATLGVAALSITKAQGLTLAPRSRHTITLQLEDADGEVPLLEDVLVLAR
jgi:hypothetical protein